MKIHNITQGSPEWHAHRATHFNASDAPAMMGCSAYKTRTQLLHELHTGISPEVDDSAKFRFAEGHRIEALARTWAEENIFDGEFLYPLVGSDGELSASFDGLLDNYSEAFEHKTLNDELRAATPAGKLPLQYRVQMEQQLTVSGASQCLFMASKWDGDTLIEECHCWYYPDLELRQQIIAGWKQFAIDLANYVPTEVKELPKARVTVDLPALFVHAKGEITTHNMEEFGVALKAKLAEIRSIVLVNDQDFSDAKAEAKKFREKAKEIALSKEAMLSQTVTIGEAARMMDAWAKDLNSTALQLEKDVEREDAAKRLAMVNAARSAFADHFHGLEDEIKPIRLPSLNLDFPSAIKNKRTYTSMQESLNDALANAKIAIDGVAKDYRAKLAWRKEIVEEFAFLFADMQQIISKPMDDFQLTITTRIANHEAAQAAKNAIATAKATPVPAPAPAQTVDLIYTPQQAATRILSARLPLAKPATPPTLRLGQINERLHPIQITADGLRTLGFEPAGRERASVLYHEYDFPRICAALVDHITRASELLAA